MKKPITVLAATALAAAVFSGVRAAEVTSEQAQTAVENWVNMSPERMESTFQSSDAQEVDTALDESGRTIFHVVNLEGGGFVVTSGDTRLSPIVAFSATGRFSGDESSPLYALLKKRLSRATASLGNSSRVYASSGPTGRSRTAYASVPSKHADAMAQWDQLLNAGKSGENDFDSLRYGDPVGSAKKSISDVRVSPLLKTKWWQGSAYRTYTVEDGAYIYTYSDPIPTFNYYTPNNYVCGCVATAGAQVMYYWKAPTSSIAQFSNTCYVNDIATVKSSIAGTFDWNNMFETWPDEDNPPSETQRKAVGKLVYNIGVAVGMDWTGGGSSAGMGELVRQLKSRFGYKSGTTIWYMIDANGYGEKPADYTARVADFRNALYASLDAKMPVLMSIHGEDENGYDLDHAIVADGYGYNSGKLYTHLNFGYNIIGFEDENVWYYIPEDPTRNVYDYSDYYDEPYVESDTYFEFQGIGINVHPTTTGDVISGRVLNTSGSPVSGATVTLYNSSGIAQSTSTADAKGIYSFRFTSAGNYSVMAKSGSLESQAKSVSVSAMSSEGSYGYYGCCTGNRWGNDLTVQPVAVTYRVTFDANGGTVSPTSRYMPAGSTLGGLPTPTLAGYECVGWFTAKSGGTQISASTKVTGSVTYYAHWKAQTYTVSFNAISADAKLSTKKKTVRYGGTYGALPTPTLDGYAFVGWFTERSAGTQVLDTTKVTATADHTLFGRWKRVSANCTVTFAANGGTVSPTKRTVSQGAAVGTLPVPTLAGYEYLGWFTAKSGGTQISASTKVTANVTYYAHWKAKTYTVSFNAISADAKLSTKKKTVRYGGTYGALPTPTLDGYAFVGWFTERSAGTQVLDTTKVTATADHTLFGRWKRSQQSITKGASSSSQQLWYTQTQYTHGGTSAWRSGTLDNSEKNWIEMTVTGSGTISFWWSVSSEKTYDKLEFIVDGVTKEAISGTDGSWYSGTFDITGNPSASHTLRWQYSKDVSDFAGLDAGFVDEIKWTQASTCQVTFNPNGGSFSSDASVRNKTFNMFVGYKLEDQPLAHGALNVEKSGKTFAGWWTATSGGTRLADTTVINGAATYYARWQ